MERLKRRQLIFGVDIGAVTPEEVALSIIADVVGTKRGKHPSHKPLMNKVVEKNP